MADSLLELFESVRRDRPPIYLADEWAHWLDAIGKVLAAFPTEARRWAAAVLVANDLVRAMPGLSLPTAYRMIAAGGGTTRSGGQNNGLNGETSRP